MIFKINIDDGWIHNKRNDSTISSYESRRIFIVYIPLCRCSIESYYIQISQLSLKWNESN